MQIEPEELVHMYRKMLTIRRFEERVSLEYRDRAIPGVVHLYIGQEAVAVGVCTNLRVDDRIVSNHRGHGHCIAKGADLKRMMAEIYGKSTGYCKGKGGSMHITQFDVGVLGATGVVASGLPIAVGAALSAKMRKTNEVVACFSGDGASNNGTFGESLNMAAIWQLPLVWVVENNLYAMGTPITLTCPSQNIADRGEAYCTPSVVVDGNNALEVYEAAVEAVKRARSGGGPSLIECKTYRMRGHSRFDQAKYRPQDEVEHWMARDSVEIIKEIVLEKKALTAKQAENIRKTLQKAVDKAADFAIKSEHPAPEEALDDVFMEVA